MAAILKGAPVAEQINNDSMKKIAELTSRGITPALAILRVGERDGDLSYERGAVKRAEALGIAIEKAALPADVSADEFFRVLDQLNADPHIHGILMLRPLPASIDDNTARNAILPAKDIDGCGDMSLAGVFTDSSIGYPPCTAQAAMEILSYYNIPMRGKKATVIGRSLVVGKPVSMMLMKEGATVTVCHRSTVDTEGCAQDADILVVACGHAEAVNARYTNDHQTVVDVGINWSETKGKLVGDVFYEDVEPIAAAITPVPGGVGSVTTAVLMSHVVEAAQRAND